QLGQAEETFLGELSRSLWLAGVLAGAIALAVGLLLTHQIVSPVRRLRRAAQRVASGDFSQRVPVSSGDEIGELATSFNAMAETLARNEEQRRHLMADIAHELRTPLTVLQGNLEAMQDGVIAASPEKLATLHQEAQLLSRLVDDLGTLSLAEEGQLKLNLAPTDLGKLIQSVVAGIETSAEEKGISVKLDIAPDVPPALADGDRIAQLLRNLLSNALRYTHQGGSITVSLKPAQALPQGGLEVIVTDTGEGIPPQALPHIFDRFYRVDSSRSRATGGAGIGLAVVKGLVETQGGQVWAESTPGQGSAFHFTMPAAIQS
ncbi:MAG: ATP-binding protein, partial [Chloroflexota bacterium]|nr:ATP-binding protein [Chloroflexota bacterium]